MDYCNLWLIIPLQPLVLTIKNFFYGFDPFFNSVHQNLQDVEERKLQEKKDIYQFSKITVP